MKIKEHANFEALKISLDDYIKDFGERDIDKNLLTDKGAPVQEFSILFHNSTGAVKNRFSDIRADNPDKSLEEQICLLLANTKGGVDKYAEFKNSVKANIEKGRTLAQLLDFLGDTEEKQSIIKSMWDANEKKKANEKATANGTPDTKK